MLAESLPALLVLGTTCHLLWAHSPPTLPHFTTAGKDLPPHLIRQQFKVGGFAQKFYFGREYCKRTGLCYNCLEPNSTKCCSCVGLSKGAGSSSKIGTVAKAAKQAAAAAAMKRKYSGA